MQLYRGLMRESSEVPQEAQRCLRDYKNLPLLASSITKASNEMKQRKKSLINGALIPIGKGRSVGLKRS